MAAECELDRMARLAREEKGREAEAGPSRQGDVPAMMVPGLIRT